MVGAKVTRGECSSRHERGRGWTVFPRSCPPGQASPRLPAFPIVPPYASPVLCGVEALEEGAHPVGLLRLSGQRHVRYLGRSLEGAEDCTSLWPTKAGMEPTSDRRYRVSKSETNRGSNLRRTCSAWTVIPIGHPVRPLRGCTQENPGTMCARPQAPSRRTLRACTRHPPGAQAGARRPARRTLRACTRHPPGAQAGARRPGRCAAAFRVTRRIVRTVASTLCFFSAILPPVSLYQEGDEKALVPERNPHMWWLGQSPNHHICGSLLRARGFFITLLGPRSVS
jgi:hypothetical protein